MHVIIGKTADIGPALRERRLAIGVTQKTLADYCQLSHNRISRIELGNTDVKLSTLVKMAKFLGLKVVLQGEP
ncbi:MAG: helix-turn-helix transcriptional regulator [Proteobacteria bacterium]|nr:helix-turn-helix transcriptional regulator [Pseudomonadota bacterium]